MSGVDHDPIVASSDLPERDVARNATLGEFEHLVMLAALRLGDAAYAPDIARVLEERARREMSRGTLYAALERLEKRGLIEWSSEEATAPRGGHRRRRFTVTALGREALAERRHVLLDLWQGVEDQLGGSTP